MEDTETKSKLSSIITKRWSPRAFSEGRISEELLMSFFEAASWASSSMNEQPWIYLYAHREDDVNFKKFHNCLMAGNQPWAEKASVLVLSLARKNFTRNDKYNRHHLHDTGAANSTLLLEAIQHDIYGHIMGGFDPEKTKETFNLPDELEIACFIALGYLGDVKQLPEPFLSRELAIRTRNPLKQFVGQGVMLPNLQKES